MKKLAFILDANAVGSVELASDYVDSRTLAANTAKSFTKPVGSTTITFSTNFEVGDVINFGNLNSGAGGISLTAVASAPTANQFVPGASLAASLTALVTQLNGLVAGNLNAGTFSATATALTFTNATSATPVQVSAAKATGTAAVTQVLGARFCRLSAGALFYYSVAGTATVAAADISNGTGSISVPSTVQPLFSVDDVASISVIAPAVCVVSAEWWG